MNIRPDVDEGQKQALAGNRQGEGLTPHETEVAKSVSVELDKIFGSLDLRGRQNLRRWKGVGEFSAMLIGLKPSALVNKNWGSWLYNSFKQVNPEISQNYDQIEIDNQQIGLFVNKSKMMELSERYPAYFPKFADYEQARDYLSKNLNTSLEGDDINPEEYARTQMITGLALGYPKEDCEQFASLNYQVMQQLTNILRVDELSRPWERLDIDKTDFDILKRFLLAASNNLKETTLSQRQQIANELAGQVKLILDKTPGVDPKVKDYFLKRRAVLANGIAFLGTMDSQERRSLVRKIDCAFEESDLNDVLSKYDIVLQNHSNEIYIV